MIASETWRRFTRHLGAMGLAGLYAVLIGLVVGTLFWLMGMLLAVNAGLGLGRFLFDGTTSLSVLFGVGVLVLLAVLLALVVTLAAVPLVTGGLVHAVVQVQRDQAVTFGELWNAGLRHWARLFRLNLIVLAVALVLRIVLAILSLVPVLGPAVWVLGAAMIMVVLGGYGPYMAVTESLGARETAAKAYRILSDKFTDVLMTVLVLLGAAVVVGLIFSVLNHLPLLGALLELAIEVFLTPLMLLYLANRYRTNIAPHFGPPGGTWHPDPPPGL